MASAISVKQRNNAEREFTSKTCAGCDGPKPRGTSFCEKCINLAVEHVKFGSSNNNNFAEAYTKQLQFLLSRKGQQLRRKLEGAGSGDSKAA
jgi:predicted amidophosphoribosyltransferase